ncbi:dipeptide ABC transporter ATP-binding protein [Kitasatospora sp. NPDC057223]|uniref:ABC transporter ATP-binding protein n=1 Tax=Kitasatospora sp. NPDC057223 TaxID=3346055 RepID=UPI00362881F9
MSRADRAVRPAVPLLSVRDLRVDGPSGAIVAGVGLDVHRGETLALVGESGSGKSMTVKALSGLLPTGVRATGTLELEGTRIPLDPGSPHWRAVRGTRIALLLQDPFTSLSPVHTCGAQIGWALPAGTSRSKRAALVAALLAEVGLPPETAGRHPHQLSGGMRQRVAIAAVLAAGPDLLIADEPTTALDVTTQHEVLELIARLQQERRMAVVLITHDLGLARSRADRIAVMYAGRLVETGTGAEVLDAPAHPYTARLAACEPPLDRRLPLLPTIPGQVPSAHTVGAGCAFADRCELVLPDCRSRYTPELAPAPGGSPGHLAACLRIGEAPAPAAPRPADPRPGDPPALDPGPAATDVRADRALLVSGLVKQFARSARPAVDSVDLRLDRGEAVAVVGQSGSGKTTLARCVVGLERPSSGTVAFPLSEPAPGADPRARRRPRPDPGRVQIVFQDPYSALNPGLSIGATLREALRAAGRPEEDPADLLELVGLPRAHLARRPRRLSGGERQRVAIARALAPRPHVLVCDEAVSALDVSVQAGVLNLLARLRRELDLSILFITHDLAIARQVADRVYVMHRGRVVEHGPAELVLTAPTHPYTRQLLASVPAAG